MSVVSFNFDKILVDKRKPLEPPIKVDTGMQIVDIKEEDVSSDKGETKKVLRFFYEYTVEYQPKQAVMEIAGSLLYVDKPEVLKEIMDEWKKTQKFSTEITKQVLNNVLVRCQIKGLSLAADVGLPPQVRLPMITSRDSQKKAAEYTG